MARSIIRTEDTGKIFEMAICLAYHIPYDGIYKYGLEEPQKLVQRLTDGLCTKFPPCVHTARGGGLHDYTAVEKEFYLSAKTTKKGGKVAPQYVGQAQPAEFCKRMGIETMPVDALKRWIQENVGRVLPTLFSYTFPEHGAVIYYNKEKNTIKYIIVTKNIPWDTFEYKWTKGWAEWNNSSTLKVHKSDSHSWNSILEVQFHSASRTNMAVRWCFEELLRQFPDCFEISAF
jgi:hypothetical protein